MEFRKKENQNRGAGDSVLSTVVDVKKRLRPSYNYCLIIKYDASTGKMARIILI